MKANVSNKPKESNKNIALSPQHQHWDVVQRQARAFLASGYLREEFTKGVSPAEAIAKVATIIIMGDELGIGRMQALRSINVIKGKPALAAELMLGLAYKRIPGFKATFKTPIDKQHLECEVTMQRPEGDPNNFKFTIEDAKKAGLEFISQQGKPTAWTKYPRAMLRARVLSEGLRAMAPDATMGCFALEELQNEIVDAEPISLNETVSAAPELKESKPEVLQPRPETGNTVSYDRRREEKMAEPCTEPQIKKLYAMGKNEGLDHDELKMWARELFEVDHLEELSKGQIQKMFVELGEPVQ